MPDIDGELALLDENISLMRSRLAMLAVVPPDATAHLSPALSEVVAPTLPLIIYLRRMLNIFINLIKIVVINLILFFIATLKKYAMIIS